MKTVLFYAIILVGSLGYADSFQTVRDGRVYTCVSSSSDDCVKSVVKVHWGLSEKGCSGAKAWACYRDLVISCSNGDEREVTQFVGCQTSFSDCR